MRLHWTLVIAAICVALLCIHASALAAEQGYQASVKTSMEINMGSMLAGVNPGPANGQDTSFSEVSFGKSYWCGTGSRTEIVPTGSEQGTVSICDVAAGVMYVLNPATKTAIKTDLSEQASSLAKMPGEDLTRFTADFDEALAELKSLPGVTISKAGSANVSGLQCECYNYTIDMSQLLSAADIDGASNGVVPDDDPESQELMNSLMGMMKPINGKLWASKKLNTLIKMEMANDYMNMSYTLSDVKPWVVDTSLFKVPADYRVVTMDEMLQNMMPEDTAPHKSSAPKKTETPKPVKPKDDRRRPH